MQKDKMLHFFYSFIIYLIFYIIFHNSFVCIDLTLSLGLAKEIWDYATKDNFSFGDLFADIIGIILAYFVCIL